LNPVKFHINGELVEASVRADMTVLEWLRLNPKLRGTKEGCAEGDCGACSILLARPGEGKLNYRAANSCIMLMGQIEGCSLVTVEGLTAEKSEPHPVQAEMAKNGSSQCGFCTPGIVMSLVGLLDNNPSPDDEQIHDALAGNLCRCTGYRPIVEAAKNAAADSIARLQKLAVAPIDNEATSKAVGNEASLFFRPKTIDDLCTMKSEHPDADLLAGGTDLALDVAQARERWSMAILTCAIPDMCKIRETDNFMEFGGAVTWEQALPYLERYWPSFAILVRRFGSTQVRSMGTIAGNIGNASPIGDGPPALMALGASVVLASVRREREVALDEFFTGYRTTVMDADEVITQIRIPLPLPDQHFRTYKISKRFDQDISTVCGAFMVTMEGSTVSKARIAYGGMAATSQRCPDAEKALIGNSLPQGMAAAAEAVSEYFSPMSDGRGSAQYRSKVAANLCERFARDIAGETIEVMAL